MCPGQVGIFGDIDREAKWAQNSRFSEFLQRPEALNGPSGIGWKENSCTTRTSQSLHQTAASQRKIICVENSSKGRFVETWIVENMLQEREAGYWPSPFWWVSLPKFFGSQFRQKVWTTSSAVAKNIVGFLVSKWMRQNIAGRLASVLLFLIHFTNGFIAISSKWFSKMAK